eukprot:NODE_77_length_23806_cov_0.393892.p19 type:complete len:103 gc:universal NODE_77_length_23806_cov_0.393892:5919-5611(-)
MESKFVISCSTSLISVKGASFDELSDESSDDSLVRLTVSIDGAFLTLLQGRLHGCGLERNSVWTSRTWASNCSSRVAKTGGICIRDDSGWFCNCPRACSWSL